jgi:choline dehydrogenase-like flavoprotein
MEMNCVEKDFKARVQNKYPDRYVPLDVLRIPYPASKGPGQCQTRNLCHRAVPYGAYFSTNASTLAGSIATGNLTLRPNSVVNKVLYDDKRVRQRSGSNRCRNRRDVTNSIRDWFPKRSRQSPLLLYCLTQRREDFRTVWEWKRSGWKESDGSSQTSWRFGTRGRI